MKKLKNKLAVSTSDMYYGYTQAILRSWSTQYIIFNQREGFADNAAGGLRGQISTKFSQMNDNVVEQKME